ncbi:MAG: serine--tRNA ligase [Thermomicrobiales bacterium]
MIDLRLIREHPDAVRDAIATLHTEAPIDQILDLDQRRRRVLTEVEALKAERNDGSKLVPKAKDPSERQSLVANLRLLGGQIDVLDREEKAVEAELHGLLLTVPNLPAANVPVGATEAENVVTGTHGARREFAFAPKPHWELGEALGIIDFERGVKVAGARNYVLRSDGARLQRALITWMLDVHTRQHGYSEVAPPYLVPAEMLVGTGSLPKFGDTLFHDAEEDKWLIPTAEVPVTNLYRDEILDEAQLPIKHVAFTPCFRREQISAGREVRGIKRGYQFDKVEMVQFVHPDLSDEAHTSLQADAETILKELKLPYQVLQICTGDLAFTAANKVDLEVWAPGSEEWLEVSSISTFRDFQARRANIRFRPEVGGKPQFVHTLNGSGLALPRTMIAIMETYQREDGTIEIPGVIRPYMHGQDIIAKQPPIGNSRN